MIIILIFRSFEIFYKDKKLKKDRLHFHYEVY